jgi:aubergine-like protein
MAFAYVHIASSIKKTKSPPRLINKLIKNKNRYNKLRDFLDKMTRVKECQDDLSKWGIEFGADAVKASALVFAPITVVFNNENRTTNTERGWNNSLRNGVPLFCTPLVEWFLFYCPRDEPKAQMFDGEVATTASAMSFKIERAKLVRLPDTRASVGTLFASAIKDHLQRGGGRGGALPQMVVCIVPNQNKDIYDAIKKVCCLEYGIASQVVTANILNTNNMNKTKSVITKLAVQMNCKLGGEPWGVIIPLKNIMVVGMDFYKDSSQRNTSVAAFVSSLNGNNPLKYNCTKYYSRCHLQPKGQEFMNGLEAFMIGKFAFLNYI